MSSIQSVPGQPESPPDSSPMHQVFVSPVAALAAAVLSSSHVAGCAALPDALVVPDQALDGALGEDAGELAIGRLAERREAGRGRRLVRREVDEVERQEHAVGVPLLHEPRARQARHVGQVAAGDGRRQRAGEVALAGVVHRHAGAVEPRRHHRVEVVLLGAGPRRIDGHFTADVLAHEAGARAGFRRRARLGRGPRCGRGRRCGAGASTAAGTGGGDERDRREKSGGPPPPDRPLLHECLLSRCRPERSGRAWASGCRRGRLVRPAGQARPGGAVDARTMSSVGSSVRLAADGSAMRSRRARPAACPSSKAGNRTVVRGGSK